MMPDSEATRKEDSAMAPRRCRISSVFVSPNWVLLHVATDMTDCAIVFPWGTGTSNYYKS